MASLDLTNFKKRAKAQLSLSSPPHSFSFLLSSPSASHEVCPQRRFGLHALVQQETGLPKPRTLGRWHSSCHRWSWRAASAPTALRAPPRPLVGVGTLSREFLAALDCSGADVADPSSGDRRLVWKLVGANRRFGCDFKCLFLSLVITPNSKLGQSGVGIRIQDHSQTRFDATNPMVVSNLENELQLKITIFESRKCGIGARE